MSRRLDLCTLAKTLYPHEPLERSTLAFLTVDDETVQKKWKTWDNALYLAMGGDTLAIKNAIDENLILDPMHELFNETF